MFAGKKTFVSAIRRKDHSIEYFELKREESVITEKLKKITLERVIITFIKASANSVKQLDFAIDRYENDPEDEEKVHEENQTSKLVIILGIGVIGVLSLLASKLIFTVTPAIVSNFFQ